MEKGDMYGILHYHKLNHESFTLMFNVMYRTNGIVQVKLFDSYSYVKIKWLIYSMGFEMSVMFQSIMWFGLFRWQFELVHIP